MPLNACGHIKHSSTLRSFLGSWWRRAPRSPLAVSLTTCSAFFTHVSPPQSSSPSCLRYPSFPHFRLHLHCNPARLPDSEEIIQRCWVSHDHEWMGECLALHLVKSCPSSKVSSSPTISVKPFLHCPGPQNESFHSKHLEHVQSWHWCDSACAVLYI